MCCNLFFFFQCDWEKIYFDWNYLKWMQNKFSTDKKSRRPERESNMGCKKGVRNQAQWRYNGMQWALCPPLLPPSNPPFIYPSIHPLLCGPSFPTRLWCAVTRSAGSSSMTDCYFLERKGIWLLTSGPLQLQTRTLYINQEVISKQRDHPPINLLGSGGHYMLL